MATKRKNQLAALMRSRLILSVNTQLTVVGISLLTMFRKTLLLMYASHAMRDNYN